MSKSRGQIWDEWRELVNMTPKELERWLDTEESQSVGDAEGDAESTGHYSGRRILKIKDTRKDDLSDDQWDWMNKVTGYVKRHCAQGGPKDDVEHSTWRYSLMNWGHDPLKDDGCQDG
ncbi:Protein of unknown function [Palleronia marisminoris]|uniref:DNA-binding protein n=1 Tax=Palleronia marisminoris TaxID=315423 RepID=A0A1Y5TGQ6_9RHOB|nr:DUF3140 domain-containing protein [Palleronia marisminoris]SFH38395.1 Protein of unknown function [Palleronia marisminoris]SLN63368.1 hypothetical protein PAM7066_03171 [Palleronia marisminoris]